MDFCHISVFIFFKTCAFHEICIHQTHFVSREETEIFLRRILHEIFTVNVKFTSERNLTFSKRLVLQIIVCFQVLDLIFRIVVDDQFDRIKDCHHTRTFQFEVFADAVLQHCIVNGALSFTDTAQVNEHLDGFWCESSSSKGCDRYQTRIIPAVHDTFFY